ncbi:MAG: hypothetical protein ACJ8F3_04750 [Xanthobacteraceae bacterium]
MMVSDDPWMAAMRRGDFTGAWAISDALLHERLRRGERPHVGPRHLQWIWNGEPLIGKRVLVRCYHGLGDTVQFVRFAAPLRALAKEVIVWAQPPLVPLVATAAGVDRALPLHDGVPEVSFDAEIELMELAHALRVDANAIRRETPYLFPARRASTLSRSPTELLVGVVWRAGDWDERRSVPAALLAPLARLPGLRLCSLQCGTPGADASLIPAQDVSSLDVETTAANLRALDLFICIDTFAAHLAGALGIPTWVLLHSDCDWRWLSEGSECLWYPSVRLFRQSREGECGSVIEEVAAALQALSTRRCRSSAVEPAG